MPQQSPKPILASLELRRLLPEEYGKVAGFYREAGYPAAIKPEDMAWGAWSGPALVGCISLCPEEGVWVMRGPEVQFEYRRHGVGRMLLELAKPEVATRTCYCLAYVYLTGLYGDAGFHSCPEADRPPALGRKLADLRALGWDLVLLKREATTNG